MSNVEGWRVWVPLETKLTSTFAIHKWLPNWNISECQYELTMPNPICNHPNECNKGFRAAKSIPELAKAYYNFGLNELYTPWLNQLTHDLDIGAYYLGRVQLAGYVTETEYGWIGEEAKITHLVNAPQSLLDYYHAIPMEMNDGDWQAIKDNYRTQEERATTLAREESGYSS